MGQGNNKSNNNKNRYGRISKSKGRRVSGRVAYDKLRENNSRDIDSPHSRSPIDNYSRIPFDFEFTIKNLSPSPRSGSAHGQGQGQRVRSLAQKAKGEERQRRRRRRKEKVENEFDSTLDNRMNGNGNVHNLHDNVSERNMYYSSNEYGKGGCWGSCRGGAYYSSDNGDEHGQPSKSRKNRRHDAGSQLQGESRRNSNGDKHSMILMDLN